MDEITVFLEPRDLRYVDSHLKSIDGQTYPKHDLHLFIGATAINASSRAVIEQYWDRSLGAYWNIILHEGGGAAPLIHSDDIYSNFTSFSIRTGITGRPASVSKSRSATFPPIRPSFSLYPRNIAGFADARGSDNLRWPVGTERPIEKCCQSRIEMKCSYLRASGPAKESACWAWAMSG